MRYRAEIDGLRALAVLPVVCYHAKVPLITGGFVGVDVFFVISGFLISSILLDEIRTGQYSILRFYERRIKRIFPALFSVIFVCFIAGYYLEFPTGYRNMSASAAAAAVFGSNIFFWRKFDYFNSDLELAPLIHTWSLAIEEQFYIFFPPMLALLCQRARRALPSVTLIAALLSFGLAVWMTRTHTQGAFYLLPPRAWELLAGVVLAMGLIPSIRQRWARNVVGAIGLTLLIWPIFWLDADSVFPGLNALPSVAGAFLLILVGADSLSGRILSVRPLVWLGLISYSLYLWHWPVLVFDSILTGGKVSVTRTGGLLILIVALSWLSWRFIETPIRKRSIIGRLQLFGGASAVMSAAVLLGLGIVAVNGVVRSYPARVQHILGFGDYAASAEQIEQFYEGTCFNAPAHRSPHGFDPASCLTIDPYRPNVLLLGDSHAAQLSRALRSEFPGVNWLQATQSWCTPVFMPAGSAFARNCPNLLNYVFEEALGGRRLDTVIMSARWSPDDAKRIGTAIAFVKHFARRVIVLGPIEEFRQPLPILLANSVLRDRPELPQQALSERPWAADAAMRQEVGQHGGKYISVIDSLCPGHVCALTNGEDPVQFDYGHLTMAGAALLLQKIKPQIPFPD